MTPDNEQFMGPVQAAALRGVQYKGLGVGGEGELGVRAGEKAIDGAKTVAGIEGTLLWAVGLLGGLENITLLFAIVCFRHSRRRALHVLVGTLAVGDLFVSFVYLPSYTLLLLGTTAPFHGTGATHDLMATATTTTDSLPRLAHDASVDVELLSVQQQLLGSAAPAADQADIRQTHKTTVMAVAGGGEFVFCVVLRGLLAQTVGLTLTISVLVMIYFYFLTLPTRTMERHFGVSRTLAYVTLTSFLTFLLVFLPVVLAPADGTVDIYFEQDVCSLRRAHIGQATGQPAPDDQRAKPDAANPSSPVSTDSIVTYRHFIALLHLAEVLLAGVFYVKICLAIRRRRASVVNSRTCLSSGAPAGNVTSAEVLLAHNYSSAMRTTTVLFASILVFWLPACVTGLASSFETSPSASRIAHRLSFDLLLLKSAVSPLIYVYGVRTLRRSIRWLCLCNCQASDDRSPRISLTDDDDCMEMRSLRRYNV